MTISKWLAAFALLAAATSSLPTQAQTTHPLGQVVTVPAIKVEPHPALEHVGNWESVLHTLQQFNNRPAADDAAVIAEIQAMGSNVPPPLLIEMGSRLVHTDIEQGRYWFMKGYVLSKLSLMACNDLTATAALQIVTSVVMEGWTSRDNPMTVLENHYKGYAQAFDNDAIDLSVSPWWACTHGMDSMRWAMDDPEKVRGLSEWYVGDEEYKAKRDQYLVSLRSFLIEQGEL